MNQLDDAKQKIKDSISLRSAMEYYGSNFNRSGFTKCPFHGEKTASFSIKNEYGHCFGCGWNGDIITFVMKYFSLDYISALKKISEDFSIPFEFDKPLKFSERYAADRLAREKQKERKKIATEHERLLDKSNKYALIYATYDKWKMIDDPEDDKYAEACRNLEVSKYLSEEADCELHRFEREHKLNS